MFSTRTRWALAPNRLAALLAARRAEGLEVLDLTLSNPTAAGLALPEGLLAPLADPASLRYEPTAAGDARARAAVVADARGRGAALDASQVVLTSSTSEAYAHLFKLLCDPGDVVLAPRPSYPLFEFLAGLESVTLRHYPLRYDGEWHLDVREVAERVDARTRAIVVVSPNNPTGSFLKRGEEAALLALCAERGLALVCDEVFADYAQGAGPEAVRTVAGRTQALTFSLGGLSKSCGLPQLKLGWIVVSGPRAAQAEALARLEVIADTFLSVSTPVQHSAPALLAQAPLLRAPIAERVLRNRDHLRAALPPGAPITLLHTEGGWSQVLHVPATRSEEDWAAALLEEDGVLVHPGWFFDFLEEAYLVVSLLPSPPVFDEGVRRLVARVAG